ncbi:hypothetical protein HOLDEFILI_03557 [Holdemania filiformis DSM 12042]|uniref:Uncharacterized protein n=1 Tax=Holdemania filiformis DSM 12042 TaxID=545696 RepID=B9YCJ6_9FIRM|nr:hypothetical protein HOLDEFILI_03557 [Holdemania filiformis DSM 12042]
MASLNHISRYFTIAIIIIIIFLLIFSCNNHEITFISCKNSHDPLLF